jgi:hypothetical protein
MNPYIEFREGLKFIHIEVLGYSYPDSDIDYDKNWLNILVSLDSTIFKGRYQCNFQTNDFTNLKNDFEILDDNFKHPIGFFTREGQLDLKISGGGLGNFSIDCQAGYYGHSLSFTLDFDQTQIKDYIRMLDGIVKAFPQVGNVWNP